MLSTTITSASLQPAAVNHFDYSSANRGPLSTGPWVSHEASKAILISEYTAWDYLRTFTYKAFWEKDCEDAPHTPLCRLFDKVIGFFVKGKKDADEPAGESSAIEKRGVVYAGRGVIVTPGTEFRDPYFVYWPPFSYPLREKYFIDSPCRKASFSDYIGRNYETSLTLTLSNTDDGGCYVLLPSSPFDESLAVIFNARSSSEFFVNKSEYFPESGFFEASSELVPLKWKLSYDSKYKLTPEFSLKLKEGLQEYTRHERKIYNAETAMFSIIPVTLGVAGVVVLSVVCVASCYGKRISPDDKSHDLNEVISHDLKEVDKGSDLTRIQGKADYGTFSIRSLLVRKSKS